LIALSNAPILVEQLTHRGVFGFWQNESCSVFVLATACLLGTGVLARRIRPHFSHAACIGGASSTPPTASPLPAQGNVR
jgi:hypothetical protein